jgi:transcriptional regulator with XRE-family HTH domain
MGEFGALLETYRERAGLSQRALSRRSGVNSAIISRLESGDRSPSGWEQVRALAAGLGLDESDTDALLAQAGHWPAAILAVGPADATLLAVACVLASDRVADTARARFRSIVEGLAEHWLADAAPAGRAPDGRAGLRAEEGR